VRANTTLAPFTRPFRISSRDGIGNIAKLVRYLLIRTNPGSSVRTSNNNQESQSVRRSSCSGTRGTLSSEYLQTNIL
jgi:hypothetical protein